MGISASKYYRITEKKTKKNPNLAQMVWNSGFVPVYHKIEHFWSNYQGTKLTEITGAQVRAQCNYTLMFWH